METGEDGLHLIAALKNVGVEGRQEPDFAMILHHQMEEKTAQERQQKVKNATHKIAQVCLAMIPTSNFNIETKFIF
jgi:hypothetical protein